MTAHSYGPATLQEISRRLESGLHGVMSESQGCPCCVELHTKLDSMIADDKWIPAFHVAWAQVKDCLRPIAARCQCETNDDELADAESKEEHVATLIARVDALERVLNKLEAWLENRLRIPYNYLLGRKGGWGDVAGELKRLREQEEV